MCLNIIRRPYREWLFHSLDMDSWNWMPSGDELVMFRFSRRVDAMRFKLEFKT